MTHRPRHSGFALLMTLVLVVLAGAALAGLARRSAEEALRTRAAVEELQRRWAVISCRATLLNRVEELLDDAEHGGGQTTGDNPASQAHAPYAQSELRVSLQLAGIDYLVVLTDEQAKFNVNLLLKDGDRAGAQAALRGFIEGASSDLDSMPAVNLHPILPSRITGFDGPPIGAYGQVFERATPEQLLGGNGTIGLAQVLTCWSDGKVNIRRAAPAVIRQACEETLGNRAVDSLLAARERSPDGSLAELLAQITIDERYRADARSRLTDRSTCHGLWVVAQGRQRSWYTLAIQTAAGRAPTGSPNGMSSGTIEFAW